MRIKEHRAVKFPLFIVCIYFSIVRNEPNCVSGDYSAYMYVVYTIHLSVGESGGYFPPLWQIAVNYTEFNMVCKWAQS